MSGQLHPETSPRPPTLLHPQATQLYILNVSFCWFESCMHRHVGRKLANVVAPLWSARSEDFLRQVEVSRGRGQEATVAKNVTKAYKGHLKCKCKGWSLQDTFQTHVEIGEGHVHLFPPWESFFLCISNPRGYLNVFVY